MSDLDCKTCGACCVMQGDDDEYDYFIPLYKVDVRRLPTKYRKKVNKSEEPNDAPYELPMKRLNGHVGCVALKGRVGKSITCAVYSRRPDYCRNYEKGSAACLEARRLLNIETSRGAIDARPEETLDGTRVDEDGRGLSSPFDEDAGTT